MMICNIEKSGKKISNSYIRKQERNTGDAVLYP